jgi:hypothetical protein
MRALRERFEAFIETFDGCENVDTLLKGNDMPGKNRADYLLRRQEIIVEQKTLEVDPTDRRRNLELNSQRRGEVSSTALFR